MILPFRGDRAASRAVRGGKYERWPPLRLPSPRSLLACGEHSLDPPARGGSLPRPRSETTVIPPFRGDRTASRAVRGGKDGWRSPLALPPPGPVPRCGRVWPRPPTRGGLQAVIPPFRGDRAASRAVRGGKYERWPPLRLPSPRSLLACGEHSLDPPARGGSLPRPRSETTVIPPFRGDRTASRAVRGGKDGWRSPLALPPTGCYSKNRGLELGDKRLFRRGWRAPGFP